MIVLFLTLSTDALKSFALTCTPQIDPREQHRQLRRLEFKTILAGCLGHLVASGLESFEADSTMPPSRLIDHPLHDTCSGSF